MTLTVNDVNTAPQAVDDTGNTDEDTTTNIAVLTNDTDANTTDTLSVDRVDATSTNGATLTLEADGTITYDPTSSATLQAMGAGATISDTFTYDVTDGTAIVTATVTITVTGVNDPALANNDANSTDNQTVLNVAAPGVLDNDEDPEGDPFTVIASDTTSAQGATVTVDTDGTYTYDPTPSTNLQALLDSQFVDDTFTYTVTGGDTATVTITVRGSSVVAPVTVDDSATGVTASQTLSINVLDNDTFQGTATVNIVTGTDVGISAAQPDGTVTYTAPDTLPGGVSNTTFTYTITDDTGLVSNTANVTVVFMVTGPSLDMVVNPTIQEVPQDLDAEFEITFINNGDVGLTDITVNFMDHFDECDIDMTTPFDLGLSETKVVNCVIYAVQENLNITLEAAVGGTQVVSAPVARFRTISFDNAPAGQIVVIQVPIQVIVTPNQNPVANNDNATVVTGTAGNIDVLANDSDPENQLDPTSVNVTTAPANGTVAVNNGAIVYTSAGGFLGADALDYQVCDASGNCANASVTINVVAQAQANNNDDDNDDDDDDNDNGSDQAVVVADNAAPSNNDVTVSGLGLQNPQGNLEWFVTVINNGTTPAQNVVITHTPNGANILDVTADGGSTIVNGQAITATIPVIQPGQRVVITITTDVTGGEMIAQTCIVDSDGSNQCQQVSAVTLLPRTGETPWWRNIVLTLGAGLFFSLSAGGLVIMRRSHA